MGAAKRKKDLGVYPSVKKELSVFDRKWHVVARAGSECYKNMKDMYETIVTPK